MDFFLLLLILSLGIIIKNIATWIKNDRQSGETLLVFDHGHRGLKLIGLTLMMLIIMASIIYGLINQQISKTGIYAGLFWTIYFCYFLFETLTRQKITETGIVTFNNYIKWKDIKTYKWVKSKWKDNYKLEITLDKPNRSTTSRMLRVEQDKKEKIDQFLKKNL